MVPMPADAESPTQPSCPLPIRRLDLFLGFAKVGLLGFGGVAASARYVIVEDRAWLSERDYAELIGLGQVLPGPNTINAAVMLGDRQHGPAGSVIAVAGLMAMPLLVLLLLAALYTRFADDPDVAAAIAGAASAAAGLVIGTALKMAQRLRPAASGIAVGLLAFAAVGLLRLPLIVAVLALAPLSVAAAWAERRA